MKISPPPWLLDPPSNQGGDILVFDADGYGIATVWCDGTQPRQDDANLIAAAPLLLSACEEALVRFWGAEESQLDALAMLRMAITKAKGEKP